MSRSFKIFSYKICKPQPPEELPWKNHCQPKGPAEGISRRKKLGRSVAPLDEPIDGRTIAGYAIRWKNPPPERPSLDETSRWKGHPMDRCVSLVGKP